MPLPDVVPMVSADLAWDIVQHQVGGPGSSDRGCVDEPLRREIWERAVAVIADCGYAAHHTAGHGGALVLYRPAQPGKQAMVALDLAAMLLSDLNLVADDAGRQLIERMLAELAEVAQAHPWEGDWGRVSAPAGGLDVVLPAATPGT